jgi:hypothetical protein
MPRAGIEWQGNCGGESVITNIRYGALGKILFDLNGKTIVIKEPKDVLLVGWPNADKWLLKHFKDLIRLADL